MKYKGSKEIIVHFDIDDVDFLRNNFEEHTKLQQHRVIMNAKIDQRLRKIEHEASAKNEELKKKQCNDFVADHIIFHTYDHMEGRCKYEGIEFETFAINDNEYNQIMYNASEYQRLSFKKSDRGLNDEEMKEFKHIEMTIDSIYNSLILKYCGSNKGKITDPFLQNELLVKIKRDPSLTQTITEEMLNDPKFRQHHYVSCPVKKETTT